MSAPVSQVAHAPQNTPPPPPRQGRIAAITSKEAYVPDYKGDAVLRCLPEVRCQSLWSGDEALSHRALGYGPLWLQLGLRAPALVSDTCHHSPFMFR